MEPGRPAVVALIGAYEPGPGEGGLRALVPLAGATLVEHQARRAAAAGAATLLFLIETVPPELADIVGRLRHEGLTVRMCESIYAVADAVDADDPVLLVADACLPEADLLAATVAAPLPALAVLPDAPALAHHERIDADTRWAGVALVDGRRIAETAAMVGSWDPVSTLLRRMVQEGAARLPAGPVAPALMIETGGREAAERAMVAAARRPGRDWIEQSVFVPVEEMLLPHLLARRVEAGMLASAALSLAVLGALLAVAGWLGVALALLVASGPVAALAARVGRVRDRPVRYGRGIARARLALVGVAGLALGYRLWAGSGQWGWMLVALLLALAPLVGRVMRRLAPGFAPAWLARTDGLVWAMLPFALAGRWGAGLAVLACYGWFSVATTVRAALGQGPAGEA